MGIGGLNRSKGNGQRPGQPYFYFYFYYVTAVCPVPGEV